MTIKEFFSYMTAHLNPLSMVKQVFPGFHATQAFSAAKQETKPWVNVGDIELTQEDFA